MSCPNCGGEMVGDGYTMVLHCENVDMPVDVESDADPIYCSPMEAMVHTIQTLVSRGYVLERASLWPVYRHLDTGKMIQVDHAGRQLDLGWSK